LFLLFSSSTYPPAPPSPLFPYTTLFRSAFARRRRFRGHHLFPTKAGPFPCGILDPFPRGVLIYPATATAKKNNCFQIWIERGRRSEEHTSELQSRGHLVCRLLLEKKKQT